MVKEISNSLNEKHDMTEFILNNNEKVSIMFDPRGDDVLLPKHLKNTPSQQLDFCFNFAVPMLDFTMNKKGIGATLSINRSSHFCWVPWDKVYCIIVSSTGMGRKWNNDVPKDLEIKNKKTPDKNSFSVIQGGRTENIETIKKTGHLRLL